VNPVILITDCDKKQIEKKPELAAVGSLLLFSGVLHATF
jgi:hypothetical protein